MQSQAVEPMKKGQTAQDLPPKTLAPGYRVGLFLLLMAVSFLVFAVGHSAWITQRTNTLWGAVLAHAAADAFLMLGGLATL